MGSIRTKQNVLSARSLDGTLASRGGKFFDGKTVKRNKSCYLDQYIWYEKVEI